MQRGYSGNIELTITSGRPKIRHLAIEAYKDDTMRGVIE